MSSMLVNPCLLILMHNVVAQFLKIYTKYKLWDVGTGVCGETVGCRDMKPIMRGAITIT